MTTVVIGSRQADRPEQQMPDLRPGGTYLQTSQASSDEPEREVKCFTAPVPVKRRLPLRAVLFLQLLLSAGAGLFVWCAVRFGSEELRTSVAEAVRGLLNG